MRRWVFNEREHEVFQRLIWDGYPFAVLIYTMELRPHMDAATRIVGDRRRVSEAGMGEMLERHAKPGSHSGTAKKRDRYYIQRQLKVLEQYGLIDRLPKERRNAPMRFLLPLADTGSFRPQEDRTMSALQGARYKTSGAPSAAKPDSAQGSDVRSCVGNSEGANMRDMPRSAQHQVSGNTEYVNTHRYTAREDVSGVETEIPLDWAPDDLLIRELQRQYGLSEAVLREQGLMFRMRARERGYIRRSWREGFRLWVSRGMSEGFAEYR